MEGILKVTHTDSVLSLCSFTKPRHSKSSKREDYMADEPSIFNDLGQLPYSACTVPGCWTAGICDHMCTAHSLSCLHISFITSYITERALWLWLNRLHLAVHPPLAGLSISQPPESSTFFFFWEHWIITPPLCCLPNKQDVRKQSVAHSSAG